MKILIADDDLVTRRLLEATLRRWGYDVVAAADGREAWQALRAEAAPGVAILDWIMPGFDGPTLCQMLRADERDEYIYLILLTSRSGKSDVVAGLEAGADDFLIKPPAPDELRSRIRVGERVVQLQRRLAQANRKLTILATTDSLTGIANRATIVARLAQELGRSQRTGHALAVAMADIDRFKSVNDRYGHQAGDAVLCELGRRLREGCRLYDNVGRYGGEEFLLIFPETDARGAALAAERIRREIADVPFQAPGGPGLTVTASFGVAQVDAAANPTIDELVSCADRALYRAKQRGRNRVEVDAGAGGPGGEPNLAPTSAAGGHE